jgi:hypothetical protein
MGRCHFAMLLIFGGLSVAACAVQPYGGRPYFAAVTPADLVEVTPAGTIGTGREGELVPLGKAWARHGVVADVDIDVGIRAIPAGTPMHGLILGGAPDEVDLPSDPTKVAWCDSRLPGVFAASEVACFRDINGDGNFDELLAGQIYTRTSPLDISPLVLREDLAEPIAYRPAGPETLSEFILGYRYCGDGETPARFRSVVASDAGRGAVSGRACVFGNRIEGDLLSIYAIRIRAAPTDGGLDWTITETLETGPIHIAGEGKPFQLAQDALSDKERLVEKLVELLTTPKFVAAGEPELRGSGRVEKGDVIMSLPVRHAITGRLVSEVEAKGLFAMGRSLPAGTPVYGVPLVGGSGIRFSESTDFTWCAPRRKTREDGRVDWDTTCLPGAALGAPRWVGAGRDLFATSLSYSDSTSGASMPDVERGPVDLGMDLTLSLEMVQWKRDHLALEWRLTEAGGESQRLSIWSVEFGEGEGAGEQDAVTAKLFGQDVVFRKSADGRDVAQFFGPDGDLDVEEGDAVF